MKKIITFSLISLIATSMTKAQTIESISDVRESISVTGYYVYEFAMSDVENSLESQIRNKGKNNRKIITISYDQKFRKRFISEDSITKEKPLVWHLTHFGDKTSTIVTDCTDLALLNYKLSKDTVKCQFELPIENNYYRGTNSRKVYKIYYIKAEGIVNTLNNTVSNRSLIGNKFDAILNFNDPQIKMISMIKVNESNPDKILTNSGISLFNESR